MSPDKMFKLAFLGFLLVFPACMQAEAVTPRGTFAELHSCELFAGPCVINSEVNQGSNYALRVWQFDQGNLNGVPLHGLTVALLEKSTENLADGGNASDAVVYLSSAASPEQRAALLAWARGNTAAALDDTHVKVAPLQMNLTADKVRFTAGNGMTFTASAPTPCPLGSCGEMLWYHPRIAATSFVVDQLGDSTIVEPLLSLRWMDHGRRTLFVGRFGDPVTTFPALCGTAL